MTLEEFKNLKALMMASIYANPSSNATLARADVNYILKALEIWRPTDDHSATLPCKICLGQPQYMGARNIGALICTSTKHKPIRTPFYTNGDKLMEEWNKLQTPTNPTEDELMEEYYR